MMAEQITVCIPYESGRRLAVAYNRAMKQAQTEWVLLLDWDLFICNPYFYDMCVYAAEQIGRYQTGWITCVTNRIGAPQQREKGAPKSNDVAEHTLYAKELFRQHSKIDGHGRLVQTRVERIPGALSGFFILTNKTAWKKCGGFDEDRKRLLGVDNRYSRALSRAGFAHYYMPGLYMYHVYGQKNDLWRGKGAGQYGAA
ncbi:hypothetical protein LCGC14_1231200 [marine sediment metagenome]|uniref:Glycosyltransferase 2-like domain-containing protein n=1 Tax=marine sediment metagenome TaxID=412755 RepID=A0A0F9PCS0_9ZZZZ